MKYIPPASLTQRIVFYIKKYKSYIFLVLATLALTSLVYNALLNDPKKMEKVAYLVSSDVIPAGEQIKDTDLASIEFVRGYEPVSGYLASEAVDLIGKEARINVEKGTLISKGMVGDFEEAPIIQIAKSSPGKKVIYFESNDFHIIPPILKKNNYIDIVAYPSSNPDLQPTVVLTRGIVIDIKYDATKDKSSISAIGLAIEDKDIMNIFSKLNRDWTLSITLHPANI